MHLCSAALVMVALAVVPLNGQTLQEFTVGIEQAGMIDHQQYRGTGVIDQGRILHAALTAYPRDWIGVEVGLSGLRVGTHPVSPSRFFQGNLISAFTVDAIFRLRSAGRVRPFVAAGGGWLSIEQIWNGGRVRDVDGGFPWNVGAGTHLYIRDRLAIKPEVRWHYPPFGGEESMLRAMLGVSVFARPRSQP